MVKEAKKKEVTPKPTPETRIVNRYADDIRIIVKAKKNPKQAGSAAWDKYQLILDMSNGGKRQLTVGEYRKEFKTKKFIGDDVGKEISHCLTHDFIALEEAPAKKGKVAA